MRRFKLLPLLIISIFLILSTAVFAKDIPAKFFVNNVRKNIVPSAFLRNNSAYVPLSAAASTVGAKVKVESKTGNFIVTLGNKKSTIKKSFVLIIKGKGFVNVKTFANAVDYTYKVDKEKKSVYIEKPKKADNTPPPPPPPPIRPPAASG